MSLSCCLAATDPEDDGPTHGAPGGPCEPRAASAPAPGQPFATDLNDLLIRHPAGTILLRVCGDSMVGGGIHPGDLLVVDRHLEPRSGRIVVALIEGAFTVKRLVRRRGSWWLEAAHPAYPAIRLGPAEGAGRTVPDGRGSHARRDDTTSDSPTEGPAADAATEAAGGGTVDACLWGVAIHAIRRL